MGVSESDLAGAAEAQTGDGGDEYLSLFIGLATVAVFALGTFVVYRYLAARRSKSGDEKASVDPMVRGHHSLHSVREVVAEEDAEEDQARPA